MDKNEKEIEILLFNKMVILTRMLNKTWKYKENNQMNKHRGKGLIMYVLSKQPKISQKDLFGMLDISKQSLAESLSKLEKAELIVRKPSTEDKRVLIVELTKKGEMLNKHYRESELSKNKESIFSDFNKDELVMLSEYFDKIIKRLDENSNCNDEFEKRKKLFNDFMTNYNE